MRFLMATFVLLAVGLLAMPARANDDDKEAKKADDGPRAELREKMIKEFDKDGDGKLSDEEREQAREKLRELRGDRGRGGPEGRRGDGPRRPPEGRRGPGGRGPEGGAPEPPKLPKPEELFAKFDKDKDEKLSKDEFKALAAWVHEHLPPPPPPGPPGPPPGGRRFEGRIEGRIFDGPLGPGPGFRGEGPGRFRGPDGPPPDGAGRGEFRRGPGPGGPPPGAGPGPLGRRFDRGERRGPPSADRDDDDDQPKAGDKDDDHQEKAEKDKVDSAI